MRRWRPSRHSPTLRPRPACRSGSCAAVRTRIIYSSRTGSGLALLDYDEDGWLDVFVVNAWGLAENPPSIEERGSNKLYRNLGTGRFEDVTERARLTSDRWGCGVCAADYDNDGHVDLYVTNFGLNALYRNRGDGTFEEVGEQAGVADPGWVRERPFSTPIGTAIWTCTSPIMWLARCRRCSPASAPILGATRSR